MKGKKDHTEKKNLFSTSFLSFLTNASSGDVIALYLRFTRVYLLLLISSLGTAWLAHASARGYFLFLDFDSEKKSKIKRPSGVVMQLSPSLLPPIKTSGQQIAKKNKSDSRRGETKKKVARTARV